MPAACGGVFDLKHICSFWRFWIMQDYGQHTTFGCWQIIPSYFPPFSVMILKQTEKLRIQKAGLDYKYSPF